MPIAAESTTSVPVPSPVPAPVPARSTTETVLQSTLETGVPLLLGLTGVGLPAGVAVGPIIHFLFEAYDKARAQYPELTHQDIINLLKHEALTLDPKAELEAAEKAVGL
jgi:hypothetical protein